MKILILSTLKKKSQNSPQRKHTCNADDGELNLIEETNVKNFSLEPLKLNELDCFLQLRHYKMIEFFWKWQKKGFALAFGSWKHRAIEKFVNEAVKQVGVAIIFVCNKVLVNKDLALLTVTKKIRPKVL